MSDVERPDRINRRTFVKWWTALTVTISGTAGLLQACAAAPTPTPTATQAKTSTAPTSAPAAPTRAPAALSSTAAPAAPAATTAPAAVKPKEGGALNFHWTWSNWNQVKPTVMAGGAESTTPTMLVHSRLVNIDREFRLRPDLAERWEVSPDATKFTFYLRKDAKFSDGKPVTARDVEATVKFYLNKKANIRPLNYPNYLKGGKDFYEGKSDTLPGLQVPNDYTVVFELEKPQAGWHSFALTDTNILPAHIYKDVDPAELKEEFAAAWFKPELQIGSGPFKFVGAEKDKYIELVRNDSYYGGRPKLDRIMFKNFGTTDTQFIAFQKGEIDVLLIPPAYGAKAKELTNVTLREHKGLSTRYFRINLTRPYLQDKRVRQALVYGMDRKGICENIWGGANFPYNSFMQPDAWLAPGLNEYEYNPEKARQLLKEAKWDPNQVLKLIYKYNDAMSRDSIAAIQQQWANIGVKTAPQYAEGSVAEGWQQNCELDKWDIHTAAWGSAYPDRYAGYFYGRGCMDMWPDPKLVDLFQKAGATPDDQKRREIYYEIQRLVNEEVPVIFFARWYRMVGVNKRVSGFTEDDIWMVPHYFMAGHMNAVNWAITG